MDRIKLSSGSSASVTLISNTFIDRYMINANGAFVKVYLYLLRCLSQSASDISLASIADKLEETEGDVLRALKYWEKAHVLSLSKNSSNQICDITILDLDKTQEPENEPEPTDKPAVITQVNFSKPSYSPMQLEQFRTFDDFNGIVDFVERLLGRTMTVKDLQTPAFLYENLEFSPELIRYLFEYCFSRNKKSFAYIEKVARDWADNNVRTVEQAKSASLAYTKEYNAVRNAFGLSRALGDTELKYLLRWCSELCMGEELIKEACSRALLKTSKPDFKYADKILDSWHKDGAHSMADVEECDKLFAKKQNASAETVKKRQTSPVIPNRFNNYIQRQYTAEDYSSIEEKWLKRN